jgi:outer membrane protein assembly factor BamD (BamD/ComL family)
VRKRHLALVLVLTCSVGGALSASPAHAEGEDRALALDLFEEGRTLFKKGDYVAALTKFEAAGHLMRTFGILLNLA